MESDGHVGPGLFEFLRELRENNDRDWFNANKRRYESEVREPLLRFITDFESRLHAISPHFVADARPSGGSMFRIYRDVRFSRDKSPYKTHAGVQFRHEMGKDAHAPGFYLHFEPDNVFAGGGIWHPDSATLGKIRNMIAGRSSRWAEIKADEHILEKHEFGGDSLKRPPRGFDPDHRHIEDLKKKDFVVSTHYDQDTATTPDFIDRYAADCAAISPFMRFLTEAVGLPY